MDNISHRAIFLNMIGNEHLFHTISVFSEEIEA